MKPFRTFTQRAKKLAHRARCDQSGMTLLDMAIAFLVISLILGPSLAAYNLWKVDNARSSTSVNQKAINTAIANYYFEKGYYPCPADPTNAPDDADYGNPDCAGTDVGGGALVGAVPFAELKIPPDNTLDGWSHKLKYAVTKAQAVDKATFDPAGGTLIVNGYQRDAANRCTAAIAPVSTEVHYILVSQGPTGIGAYTSEGILRQACPAVGTNTEAENCNDDDTFFIDDCAASSRETSANFYDDMTDFKTSIPSQIWSNSPVDENNIFTDINYIGINNPSPVANLDVIGNIKADRNNTGDICDADGKNCFSAQLIGGSSTKMDCSNGGGITGIRNAGAACKPGYTLSTKTCNTAAGEYVKGIDASGNVICGT